MAKQQRRTRSDNSGPGRPESPRELVVIMRQDANVIASPEGIRSRSGMRMNSVSDILSKAGAAIRPLFGPSEERVRASMGPIVRAAGIGDPAVFYRVIADDDRLDELAGALAEAEPVEAAYVKPPASPANLFEAIEPSTIEAPPTTPDFTARQGYLDASPGGINARWAWTRPGGRGANVNIIDIEGAWRFTHEDLTQSQGGVVGGTPSSDIVWRNHGTAVIGVFGGDLNGVGITGIATEAVTTAYSIFGSGNSSSAAIRAAAARLRAGDILLIELHRPGPRHNFASRDDQAGYIAVEWWPDDFAAIQFATGRGVIVVEAAGNGAENLDDGIYNTPAAGFPTWWRNPFNRANPDAGAVIVGAGAPPTLNHGPDRSRLDFSNFGTCVDAQGWGRDVCTAGYGDLQGGSNEDLWYTASFSGTSSASPIVVGALACVQGILRARGATLLTPATARQRLHATGSPQTDAPGRPASQRIGNRPDIRAIVEAILGKGLLKEVKDKEKAEVKESKDGAKDKIETKELVKDKVEVKEFKEKEKIEGKEGKAEAKEFKEREKPIRDKIKDFKEIREGKLQDVMDRQPAEAGSIEARLAAVEAQLAHFIGAELRPAVGQAVYDDEQAKIDLLRQEAQAQLVAAKDAKDYKDSEV